MLSLRAVLCLGLLGCGAKTGLSVPDADSRTDVCAPEQCNGLDDDCDGVVDDGLFCFFLNDEPIEAAARGACGPEWYSYGSPDPESANPTPDIRRSNEVVVAVQAGAGDCGAYIAVIADLPNDGSMGALTGRFVVTEGRVEGIAVGDEPRECVFDEPSATIACDWVWQNCCTDGALVGPFRDDFCVDVVLAAPSGLERASALDGAGPNRTLPFGRTAEFCGRFTPAA